MLSQQSKKNIKRKLNFIYKSTKSKKELKIYADEIFQVINKYNKHGKKGKKLNSKIETMFLMCYIVHLFKKIGPYYPVLGM